MKKLKLLIILAMVTMLMLTGCDKTLSGTYQSTGTISEKMEFDRDGNVTVTAFGLDVSGRYKIEDDRITIRYTVLGLNYTMEGSYENKGDSIIINDTEFEKVK